MVKVLILTPDLQPGGNLATMSRIKSHIESFGHDCELRSAKEFDTHKDLQLHTMSTKPDVIIAIHALKSGAMAKECGVPLILIIGGSDVNVCAGDPDKLAVMNDVMRQARIVVSFSENLKQKAQSVWPFLDDAKIRIVAQAMETYPSERLGHGIMSVPAATLIGHGKTKRLWQSYRRDRLVVFSLIAGIRHVKDPLFLVSSFQDWHGQNNNIVYLILGHKLDPFYSEKKFEPEVCRRPGVLFIPGVTPAIAHLIMKNSFAVVNSSVDEGMSLAILEAMQLNVPVLARRNIGNEAIVEDGRTGLLFDSQQVFLQQAKRLLSEPGLRNQLVQNASHHVTTRHGMESERQAYGSLVRQCSSVNGSVNTISQYF